MPRSSRRNAAAIIWVGRSRSFHTSPTRSSVGSGWSAKETGAEIVILEVGGTVGDIESQPFLEALRQIRNEVGRENCLFIHVTWLPTIGATGEIKTKPTQHSVAALRSIGISPNMIIARSDQDVDKSLCEKIALFCDVEKDSVIPMKTAEVLYEVPLLLEKVGVGELVRHLNWLKPNATRTAAMEETCGSMCGSRSLR